MSDSGKTESWLLQKIKENPFQFSWSLGLMFGGAILIGFFFQIAFMPDMSFSEASGIFIAAASVGLMIVLPILLAMMPAILVQISEFAKNRYKNKSHFLWNAVFSIIFSLAIAYCSIDYRCIWITYLIICLLISCMRAQIHSENNNSSKNEESAPDKHKTIFLFQNISFIAVDAFIWSAFPIMLSILFLGYGGFAQNIGMDTSIPFVLWIAFTCGFTYILIFHLEDNDLWIWPLIFIAHIIFSFALSGAIKQSPSIIIKTLGLGERQVSVLLKKEGCDAFNAISKSTGEGEICKDNFVNSIYLKSRIASPYVFEKRKESKKEEDPKKKEENKVLWRITIPKEYVVSLIFQEQNSDKSTGILPSGSGASNDGKQDELDQAAPEKASPNQVTILKKQVISLITSDAHSEKKSENNGSRLSGSDASNGGKQDKLGQTAPEKASLNQVTILKKQVISLITSDARSEKKSENHGSQLSGSGASNSKKQDELGRNAPEKASLSKAAPAPRKTADPPQQNKSRKTRPNKTPAQTSPAKCLTTCCMCCTPAASCHIPPNCPPKAKQGSESRAQPC